MTLFLSAFAAAGEAVREWQVCGPFESRSVLTAVVENEGAVTPAAEVAGKAWKKITSDQAIIDQALAEVDAAFEA